MPATDHHAQQEHVNSCVVACTRIILSWLGRPSQEAAISASWEASKRGYDMESAARALGGKRYPLDPDEPKNYDQLRAWLARPLWLIAQMYSVSMGRFADTLRPPPAPVFSSLRSASVGELHAIVLVGAEETSFRYLDPYFPAHGQPFVMPRDTFAEAWQGAIVVPASNQEQP